MIRFRLNHFVGVAIIMALSLFCYMRYFQGETMKDSVTCAGVVLAVFSLYLAAYTLIENHRWNRFQYTLQMMANWNNQVRSHLDVLFTAFPELMKPKIEDDSKKWTISAERVAELTADSPSLHDVTIKNAIFTTFNFFEAMARAYELNAVEKQTVRESFGPMMLDTWHFFAPFVQRVSDTDRRNPWPPLLRVCKLWNAVDFRDTIAQQVVDADSELKVAVADIGRRSEPPTGI